MSHQVSFFFIDHADTHHFEAQFQLYLNVTIPTILYIYMQQSLVFLVNSVIYSVIVLVSGSEAAYWYN